MNTGNADGPRAGLLEWLRGHIASKPWRFALAGSVVLLVLGLLAWRAEFDRAAMAALWGQVEGFLQARPWAMFAALAILPGLPFPVSALLLAAGVAWSDHPVWACGLSLCALAINMSWTYWVAEGPGRRLVEWFMRWTGMKIPDIPSGEHLRLILVLRLTPGIPLFFQNYALGFVRAPFRLYLPLSIVISGVYSSGIVLVGAGVSDGKFLPILTGVGLLVVAVVVTKWLRAKLARRKEGGTPSPASESSGREDAGPPG